MIAEIYNINKDQEKKFFKSDLKVSERIRQLRESDSAKKLDSVKKDINSARLNICAEGRDTIPLELKMKVQEQVQRN